MHPEVLMRPIALTDHQLLLVEQAAKTLPVSDRDEFLRGVASKLGAEPTNDAVRHAIDRQLEVNRIPTFLCGSVPKETR
jgi:hypothetical protein